MIPTTTEDWDEFDGDGVATNFPITTPIKDFLSKWNVPGYPTVVVKIKKADGSIELAGAGDYIYTVDPIAKEVQFSSAIPEGETGYIIPSIPINQLRDFVFGSSLPPDEFEKGLDKLTLIAQEIRRILDNHIGLELPESDVLMDLPGAGVRADRVIGFDATGKNLEMKDLIDVGTPVNAWVADNILPAANAAAARAALSAYSAAEIDTLIDDLAGDGRTEETVKDNADNIEDLAGAGRTTENIKDNADNIVESRNDIESNQAMISSLAVGVWSEHSGLPISPQGISWSESLSIFCACFADGGIRTSPDGINWTARTSGTTEDLLSIDWSPDLSLFCIVADGSAVVLTSPDGINWTTRTAAEANGWEKVRWSSELSLFCAVSRDGTNRVMTSPDGITWTARSAASASSWRDLDWSPERSIFCAVASGGEVMTSPDGITWTARSNTTGSYPYAIRWSPKLELFVSTTYGVSDSINVMTSSDGITWTARSTPVDGLWLGLEWSDDLEIFCAVSWDGHYILTSSDGINWNLRFTATTYCRDVCWGSGAGKFVVVAGSTATCYSVCSLPTK